MIKIKRTIPAVLLAAAICLTASGCGRGADAPLSSPAQPEPSASAQPQPESSDTPQERARLEKADYLSYKFAYSISQKSLGDALTETAERECTESYSRAGGTEDVARLCETWVYDGVSPGGYSCGAAFLTWSADICGLIDTGTFVRSTDLSEVYEHLTDVNEFEVEPLADATQFGGSDYSARNGDILFWTDDDGAVVNAGIVTLAQGGGLVAAICSSGSSVASFTLEHSLRGEHIINRCVLVRVCYPYNEQLIFLYLVNELGYSSAVACGALANMYCESLFEPGIEEVDFSEGYGICQWTGGRRASFEMWCAADGLDHSRLNSQLSFMKYELENNVAGDLDWRLRRLGNTQQDAYDAGVLWCEMYENPVEDEAKFRGELARDSFFTAYSGHPYM